MPYYINEKEVGYAEYIKYLEEVIMVAEQRLDELSSCGIPCSLSYYIDEAVNIINSNRKK